MEVIINLLAKLALLLFPKQLLEKLANISMPAHCGLFFHPLLHRLGKGNVH